MSGTQKQVFCLCEYLCVKISFSLTGSKDKKKTGFWSILAIKKKKEKMTTMRCRMRQRIVCMKPFGNMFTKSQSFSWRSKHPLVIWFPLLLRHHLNCNKQKIKGNTRLNIMLQLMYNTQPTSQLSYCIFGWDVGFLGQRGFLHESRFACLW